MSGNMFGEICPGEMSGSRNFVVCSFFVIYLSHSLYLDLIN